MKTWKHKTILGAIAGSGEFEFMVGETKATVLSHSTHKTLYLEGDGETQVVKVKDCKLIARHVDSITDEELEHYQYEIPLKDISIGNNLTMETPEPFLYLLSIGVLPESLADEDVIWR